jgi:PDDEXK-like uncharacterized protein DUF3799
MNRFIDGLDMQKYHAGPELSSSGLKELALSEAHYWASKLNRPHRREVIGTLTHMRTLERPLFDKMVVVVDGHRGKTEVKDAVARAESAGQIVVKTEEYEDVVQMSAAIMAHPKAKHLFQGGVAERSFYWTDADTGAPLRCRTDYFIPGTMVISDIKYFANLTDFELQRQIRKMRYDWSAAFYEDGVKSVTGADVAVFAHVFVEQPRFPGDHIGVRVITLTEEDLNFAREQYRPLIEKFAVAHNAQVWPGYSPEISSLRVPPRY